MAETSVPRRRLEIDPLPFRGGIDADGHVLEPVDLWETYLEAAYRDRAIRMKVDAEGLEYVEINGTPTAGRHGAVSLVGLMGGEDREIGPHQRYADNMPFGAGDPAERVQALDEQNIERAVLYPTLGLGWEAVVDDQELAYAYARAYNRWIADFCRDRDDRLVGIAHIVLLDPEEAANELRRACADGCRGGFLPLFTRARKSHGHPDYDAFWAAAVELDVPITFHPGGDPAVVNEGFYGRYTDVNSLHWYTNVLHGQRAQQTLAALMVSGVFDRFPDLTVGILESSAGWLPPLLERMDVLTEHNMGAFSMGAQPMTRKPSEYFRENVFISADPEERAVVSSIERVGSDRFVWASDFPHCDHPETYTTNIAEFTEPLSDEARTNVLGENARRFYHLPARSN